MIVTIEGEFLGVERWTDKKTGELRAATDLVSGNEAVHIMDYDAGESVKRLAPVSVKCEMRVYRNGDVSFRAIKG